jgi:hypothetical protein
MPTRPTWFSTILLPTIVAERGEAMRTKKGTFVHRTGTSVPKKGTFVHGPRRGDGSEVSYSIAIATALRSDLGMTHQAVKSVMRWTGASERSVKYWFAGARGPSGQHLIALAARSDVILDVFLQRAGRPPYVAAQRLIEAYTKLQSAMEEIHDIIDASGGH